MDKSNFKKELVKLMKAQLKLNKQISDFWTELKILHDIDFSEIPSGACNADNLEEAINCYISYSEYSPEELWGELQAYLIEREDDQASK